MTRCCAFFVLGDAGDVAMDHVEDPDDVGESQCRQVLPLAAHVMAALAALRAPDDPVLWCCFPCCLDFDNSNPTLK